MDESQGIGMIKTDKFKLLRDKYKLLERLDDYEKQAKNLRAQIQDLTAKLNGTIMLEEKVRLDLGELLGFNESQESFDELLEQDCNSMEC
jgi:regulator of replication initiation timing